MANQQVFSAEVNRWLLGSNFIHIITLSLRLACMLLIRLQIEEWTGDTGVFYYTSDSWTRRAAIPAAATALWAAIFLYAPRVHVH